MTETMLSVIAESFPLTELSCEEYAKLKVSGMHFSIRRFAAEGLGSISLMVAKGFFGLMKMDTMIITPTAVDMPLFSYDRVHAMGNDTLIFELYDTLLENTDLSPLEEVKTKAAYLPDHDWGAHWYDAIKLPVSLSKKGKKSHSADFDTTAIHYLAQYLSVAKTAPTTDAAPKREKAAVYVEGLLKNGGPSTDVFKKSIGEENTAKVFRQYLFGTEA